MRRFGQSLSEFFYNLDIQTVIKIQNREAHMITNETRTSIKKNLWDALGFYGGQIVGCSERVYDSVSWKGRTLQQDGAFIIWHG